MNRSVREATGQPILFRGPASGKGLRRRVILSQVPLVITSLLTAGLAWAWFPGLLDNTLFVAFLVTQVLLMVGCAVIPWDRLPPHSFLLVPLLDFVSIALGREGGQDSISGISLLSVFPVIWLCSSGLYPRLSVASSFLGPLAIIWIPLFLNGNASGPELVRTLLFPVTMLGIGLTVSYLERAASRQQGILTEKDAQLRSALDSSRRQEELLNTVLDTVHVGVHAVDGSGNDILMNRPQRINQALATPPDSAGPTESQLLVFGADKVTPLPAESRPTRRAVRGEAFTNVLVWLGSGPGQRAFSASARPMHDPEGGFAGSVVVFSDVTDLVDALSAKDDFVASVSHEFRTPLTSILGYVELLIDDDPQDHQLSSLDIIHRNSGRLLTLVSDLLAIRQGQLAVSMNTVDVVDLVQTCISAAQPRAAAAGVVLQGTLPDSLLASVDGPRLGQVLDNLVSNAIKYSPDGGQVTVALDSVDGGLSCSVEDTGMGLGSADLAVVFDRFFRATSVRNTSIPGVGLGLSICKEIVEAHGGTIHVTSVLGSGTTFTFHLPAPVSSRAVNPGMPVC